MAADGAVLTQLLAAAVDAEAAAAVALLGGVRAAAVTARQELARPAGLPLLAGLQTRRARGAVAERRRREGGQHGHRGAQSSSSHRGGDELWPDLTGNNGALVTLGTMCGTARLPPG